FQKVFGGALPIILGSITAFIVSQLLDVYLFGFFKKLTNGKYIWLRATGSTAISQLFDSYIVLIIGFWIPGNYTLCEIAILGITGYSMKLILAVLLTPFIYALHAIIRKLLKQENETIS
ncbi:MAG: queuosine precursor transporter, partial [Fluviicola sp.]